MQQRTLGPDLRVSALGYGAMVLIGLYRETGGATAVDAPGGAAVGAALP